MAVRECLVDELEYHRTEKAAQESKDRVFQAAMGDPVRTTALVRHQSLDISFHFILGRQHV